MVVTKSKKLARNLLTDALLRKKKLLAQNESYRTNKWLLSGRQSKAGAHVEYLAKFIKGNDLHTLHNILATVKTELANYSAITVRNEEKIYRQKNVEKSLEKKIFFTCSDAALLFASICRAKKIPCRIMPKLNKKWFEENLWYRDASHVFAEAFIEGKWILADPYSGIIISELKDHQKNYALLQENIHDFEGTKLFGLKESVASALKKRQRFLNKEKRINY